MNYFLIGGDQKEYGPASAEEIRQWVKEGRANGQTLLRPEGETLWKPLSFYPDFIELAATLPPPLPASAPQSSVPVAADVPVRIGHAFGRAWQLANEHFGLIFGACFLAWMGITGLLLFPYIGPYLEIAFFGPIFGGLFLIFLKVIREGDASPSDVIVLARVNAGQLIVVSVVATLLVQIATLCLCVPGIYLQIAWLLAIPLAADKKLDFWKALETSRRTVTRHWFKFCGLFVFAFLPVLVFHFYFYTRMSLDLYPISREFFEAVMSGSVSPDAYEKFRKGSYEVAKNYGWWILIKQLLLLVSMPLGIGSFAFVYEDLFGRKR